LPVKKPSCGKSAPTLAWIIASPLEPEAFIWTQRPSEISRTVWNSSYLFCFRSRSFHGDSLVILQWEKLGNVASVRVS
jgi:hypothetical protein